jgi:hypothetical protein
MKRSLIPTPTNSIQWALLLLTLICVCALVIGVIAMIIVYFSSHPDILTRLLDHVFKGP